MKSKWYLIKGIERLDSPALTVHPERIQHNIDMMIAMVKDPHRLRPHVKTYKMSEIVSMQLRSGIRKFKCATIAEAEMLAMTSAPDVPTPINNRSQPRPSIRGKNKLAK